MKITIDLTVHAAELVDALKALGAALAGAGLSAPQVAAVAQMPTPPLPQEPAPQPTPPPPAPLAPPASLPTTTQGYSMEQLAVAATTVIDAGRRQEVVHLLGQLGATSLMSLPKEQYGNFATQLRALGAKL